VEPYFLGTTLTFNSNSSTLFSQQVLFHISACVLYTIFENRKQCKFNRRKNRKHFLKINNSYNEFVRIKECQLNQCHRDSKHAFQLLKYRVTYDVILFFFLHNAGEIVL
jgi:hypothetical protein